MIQKRHITKPLISIVAPVYNEEACIQEFLKRITKVIKDNKINYELVLVNDGSNDNSPLIIVKEALENKRIKLINFSRNFGHQVAVSAGLDFAKGDAVVIIDTDLQDPPEVIPELINKWQEGFDIVNARRKTRKDSFLKILSARFFYRILNLLLSSHIPENVGDFRLLDQRPVAVLRSFEEKSRYLRGLSSWIGFDQTFVDYDRDARFAGSTHYPIKKMLQLAFNAIFSFSSIPLKIANVTAFFFLFIAFVVFCYVSGSMIFGQTVPGWASQILIFTTFNGIELFVLGIISEYIGRIYSQVQNRPLYIVSDTINLK
ncbi:MAG: glycosyltransferase family 2 protein [bacterium]